MVSCRSRPNIWPLAGNISRSHLGPIAELAPLDGHHVLTDRPVWKHQSLRTHAAFSLPLVEVR
jgi:hypothetical protein